MADEPLPRMGPTLAEAAEATLMFHRGGFWSFEDKARWHKLTDSEEVTTKALCDFVRDALASAGIYADDGPVLAAPGGIVTLDRKSKAQRDFEAGLGVMHRPSGLTDQQWMQRQRQRVAGMLAPLPGLYGRGAVLGFQAVAHPDGSSAFDVDWKAG